MLFPSGFSASKSIIESQRQKACSRHFALSRPKDRNERLYANTRNEALFRRTVQLDLASPSP
jgi:hypothetical protein